MVAVAGFQITTMSLRKTYAEIGVIKADDQSYERSLSILSHSSTGDGLE